MAEATTRPARARGTRAATTTAAKKATPAPVAKAAKPAAAAAAAVPAETPAAPADDAGQLRLVYEKGEDTKSYTIFHPPAGSGVVGKMYCPHGTRAVRVLLIVDTEAE